MAAVSSIVVRTYSDPSTPIIPKLFLFPGGEPHCEFNKDFIFQKVMGEAVWVEAHINSMVDLGYLLVVVDALQNLKPRAIGLYLPYILGGRQDHPMLGEPATLAIVARIIQNLGVDPVVTVDPHSIATMALLDSDYFHPLAAGLPFHNSPQEKLLKDYNGLICPDAGAEKRVEVIAERVGLPVIYARKHRDQATGHLSRFSVEPLPDVGRYLIVDDICDGGGTFVGLAKKIREAQVGAASILDLYVTHGIFSKGFKTLKQHFEKIITTDSVQTVVAEEELGYWKSSVTVLELGPIVERIMMLRLP